VERIDLHVHSSASDGTDPPAEVMLRAAAAGLDVVALTDHDTVSGIARASETLPPGLTLVPGMELSCLLAGNSVHMLAYLFDLGDPALSAETELIRDDRVHRARAMVGRLRELGAPVTWDQVTATADWIGDGGRAHVGRYAPDPERAIALVRAAGGVPVLAHPGSPGYEIKDEVIIGLAAAGLAGVEVFHPDHDVSERLRLTALATRLDLVMTGGSDDHGSFNGTGLGAETTPPDQYERLLAQAVGP
jgi:predicted metal-dependent phosphoesterase TrpH